MSNEYMRGADDMAEFIVDNVSVNCEDCTFIASCGYDTSCKQVFIDKFKDWIKEQK